MGLVMMRARGAKDRLEILKFDEGSLRPMAGLANSGGLGCTGVESRATWPLFI